MALGTHAQGFVGIAFETTYGTYIAPTKFFPIKSESLTEAYENEQRRVIRGVADTLGTIPGWSHVEGDIEMEVMENVLPYFLFCSRNTVVKSGTTPNFVYTTTPEHWGSSASLPTGKKGLSITVVKNGIVFGFTGCIVGGIELATDGGIPNITFTIHGRAETVQTAPVPTYAAADTPFGAGQYTIEIPTTTQVFDVNSFTFNSNDNPESQNRLMNNRYAQWVKWGERECTLEVERDFDTRAEWDAFKALTANSVKILMTKGTNNQVQLTLPNAVRDTHENDGLSDQGSATMMRTTFRGHYDTVTSKSYEIVVKCQTDIT